MLYSNFRLFHSFNISKYRYCLLLFTIIFLIFTRYFWLDGEVISPHYQAEELASNTQVINLKENRKFSDFSSVFIPEITGFLKGKHSGWLSLWTNKNELGRPLYHLSGFSPAYVLSLIISKFVDNAYIYITILSLSIAYLSGIFILLFCRECNLAPLSGLVAAVCLTFSPPFMYWLTFPMFLSVWCWSACILWAIQRIYKKRDAWGWLGLSFGCYSLLMTGYPQPIVFHMYLIGGYSTLLMYKIYRKSIKDFRLTFYWGGSAIIVGAICAAPVYLDLAYNLSQSARVSPDVSFFTKTLPDFHGVWEFVKFLILSFIPEIYGNTIQLPYPLHYDGLSTTLFSLFMLIFSCMFSFKSLNGYSYYWWAFIIIAIMFTFIPSLYVLGVDFLGFNLSRSNPLATLLLPIIIIMAFSVDALLKYKDFNRIKRALYVAGSISLLFLFLGVFYGVHLSLKIYYTKVIFMALVIIFSMITFRSYKEYYTCSITAVLLILVFIFSPAKVFHKKLDEIIMTSDLIKIIQNNIGNSNLAIISSNVNLLPPNINVIVGINSIHSYNSLSSDKYHYLIKELGGSSITYGRINKFINPDYSSDYFWMSNIGMILSRDKLDSPNLSYIDHMSDLYVYKVNSDSRMGRSIQVIVDKDIVITDNDVSITHLKDSHHKIFKPKVQLLYDDLLEYKVETYNAESIFILSQKYHRDWVAELKTSQGWLPAKTLIVNHVFQGVLIPKGVKQIRLKFKPYVTYSWVVHAFWGVLFLLLVSLLLYKKYFRGRHG